MSSSGEKNLNEKSEATTESSWFSNPYVIYLAMAFVVVLILVYIYHSYYKSEKITSDESPEKTKKKKKSSEILEDEDDNPIDKLIDSIEERQSENEKIN